jgi:hypothetical protein
MKSPCLTTLFALALALSIALQTLASEVSPGSIGEKVVPFLQRECADCHGEEKQKGKFALHDINPDIASGQDIERWEKILEMVSIGDMPPEDEPPLTRTQRDALLSWLTGELQAIGRGPEKGRESFPRFGNRIDHDALFSGEHTGPAFTQSRLWRISPSIYQQFAKEVDMARKLTAPLMEAYPHGFRDYALLFADEATIMTMMQNSRRIAQSLIHGRVIVQTKKSIDAKPKRHPSRHGMLTEFATGDGIPGRAEMERVVNYACEYLLHRPAHKEEYARYIDDFLLPSVELGGRDEALQGTLSAMMLSPEFLFRMELGMGTESPDGRRRLSPREIAYALSFAVFDYLNPTLLTATDEGRLETREDIAREFRRILEEPDARIGKSAGKRLWPIGKGGGKQLEAAYPRLLRFFGEYFDYAKAPDVFKDQTRHDEKHIPYDLVKDADWLVLSILKDDRQVLEQLLTTDEFIVDYTRTRKPRTHAYNLGPQGERFDDAVKMPEGQRAGILTHPAWLIAHSGNFENDPVRRGKWIRERLLADVVPELPIGVEAQLPEEPHRTLKERFEVVEAEECWRCHRKMNPLGDPFDAYDDFGLHRTEHLIGEDNNVIASEFEAHSKLRRSTRDRGLSPEEFKTRPVDTTGLLSGTGDPQLDGEVSGPIDLMNRLAQSDRVRQSFIRHVFRYWMGRNEMLSDSPTLMAMDKAYLASDGSFKELLVALVTSDSFLYRK